MLKTINMNVFFSLSVLIFTEWAVTDTLSLITLDLCIDSSSFPDRSIFNVYKNDLLTLKY